MAVSFNSCGLEHMQRVAAITLTSNHFARLQVNIHAPQERGRKNSGGTRGKYSKSSVAPSLIACLCDGCNWVGPNLNFQLFQRQPTFPTATNFSNLLSISRLAQTALSTVWVFFFFLKYSKFSYKYPSSSNTIFTQIPPLTSFIFSHFPYQFFECFFLNGYLASFRRATIVCFLGTSIHLPHHRPISKQKQFMEKSLRRLCSKLESISRRTFSNRSYQSWYGVTLSALEEMALKVAFM